MNKLSRRDFLKLSGAALAGAFVSPNLLRASGRGGRQPNIILILLDALSARHMSLHGYPRPTTPNIEAFARQSVVYHRHYSGGNFTVSGTASMLTGMLPWRHSAVAGGGLVRPQFVRCNMFSLLGEKYYRFAFAQNTWADRLVGQTPKDVERFLSPFAYSRMADQPLLLNLPNDRALASTSINDFLFNLDGSQEFPGSVALGYLSKTQRERASVSDKYVTKSYPKGFPYAMNGIVYRNEEIYEGVYREIENFGNRPYFAYFHLFSPHGPYRPRSDYRKLFMDKYSPQEKPLHPLARLYPGLASQKDSSSPRNQRALYDAQIAQVDEEIGKLFARLKERGILDDSYVILTSDHGELFERGFWGHGNLFMYEGVVHIPLIIRRPGQTNGMDVFTPTSNADILPTLLSIAGESIPPEVEGRVLPGFSEQPEDKNRPIFSIHGRDNSIFAPLEKTAISMLKDGKKIIAYLAYAPAPVFELYDLENDPEERNDISSKDQHALSVLKDELLENLQQANRLLKTLNDPAK